jgi:hypothetical protein
MPEKPTNKSPLLFPILFHQGSGDQFDLEPSEQISGLGERGDALWKL